MDDKPAPKRRQRQRIACEPCRERKRKCNGAQPCDMCEGFNYDCVYRSTPRKKRLKSNEMASTHLLSPPEESSTVRPDEQGVVSPVEFSRNLQQANSGSAFVQNFSMAVDPSNRPLPFLAWNLFLGERSVKSPAENVQSITDLLSFSDMSQLAEAFFGKVDRCYGFLDRDGVEQAIQQRWSSSGQSTLYDAVLCGVAAVGNVFSNLQDFVTETAIFSLAKWLLANTEEVTVDGALAWVLRTVYLRVAGRPEEAWMSSCTALHMVDAAGLHCEPTVDCDTRFQTGGRTMTPDDRRRTFGVARHLNVWLSFDLSRSRVVLQNGSITPPSSVPPSHRPNDYTNELLGLLRYTESLDPGKALSGAELLASFTEVLDRVHTQPPSVLAQNNLMLCLYRRLYTLRYEVPSDVLAKAISLIQQGIRAVHSMVENGSPWHHLANVPFQAICTLLAIDTPQSFALLADATACLDTVNQAYRTRATRDAVAAAHALIFMHQQRREADFKRQSEMLKLYPSSQIVNNQSFDDFLLSQAFTDLPWVNDLLPDIEWGALEQFCGL